MAQKLFKLEKVLIKMICKDQMFQPVNFRMDNKKGEELLRASSESQEIIYRQALGCQI